MTPDTLDLWFAYPDDFSDAAVFERSLALLSPDERQRMESFKFETSRREYLAAHTLARTALSHAAGKSPQSWAFRANEYGKPFLDPDCGLHFNLSRRAGLVACLVGFAHPVGVDVESYARASDVLGVRETVFSSQELAQLEEGTDEEKRDHALSLWTLKEAYVKARGMGLSLPLKEFSFLRGPSGDLRLEVDASIGGHPAQWRFCLLDHASYRLALVTGHLRASPLHVRELRPTPEPSSRPIQVHAMWFPYPQESA